ncbi:guanine nucleotide-binding protein G(I), variant [Capsaspora owczarzaki ATCC 30864]|nr:guanine nucleotide-binding protein G(I), variant [Capsaspora owczarzaki ATCC 30864]
MKAVHSPEGLTAEECERRMEAIFLHVCDSARTIATAMTAMRIPFTDPENCQPCVALLEAAAGQHPVEWDNSLLMACRTLWADQGFRLCFSRSREYQLNDNTDYFFNALDRLTSLNYVPTPLDVFRSRAKTVGIYETRINFPNNILCTVTDVGGQQSERRKWAQCFAGVTAIIFVVATSEYDQLLREDGRTNRLREAFRVFREVWEDRFLATTPIILFLNKTDLLAAKLPISDFRVHFPEYNQEVADYESVTQYLIRRLHKLGARPTSI